MANQAYPGQPPIPEPAPELCAWAPCAVGGPDCAKRAPGTKEQHDRRRLKFPFTHDFVAPQAKPVSAGAPQNVGSIGPAGELIPAKPVLREPKPAFPVAGEVWAYAGHEIGEVSKVVNEKIYGDTLYFSNDHPPMFWNDGNAWTRVRPAKPAAKDIPSLGGSLPTVQNTEAARGGEAAITKRLRFPCGYDCSPVGTCAINRPQHGIETQKSKSAVADAPAIEPWRPSVDDDFWIPDAREGWRR